MDGILHAWPRLMGDIAAMHRLIVLKEVPMVRILRRRRFKLDAPAPHTGHTALMEAARTGHCVLLMHLVDRRGASLDARDARGWTVRHHLEHQLGASAQGDRRAYHRCRIMLKLLDRDNWDVRRFVKAMRRNHAL